MKNNFLKLFFILLLIISNKIIAQNVDRKNEQTAKFAQNKGKYAIPLTKHKDINDQCAKIRIACHVFERRNICDNQQIEIFGAENSFVLSIAAGKIVKIIDSQVDDSKTIIIRHGDFFTVYSNVINFKNSKSNLIRKNQKIGQLIKKGEKYCLEFQIWQKTETVNPLDWINVIK